MPWPKPFAKMRVLVFVHTPRSVTGAPAALVVGITMDFSGHHPFIKRKSPMITI